jgi:hypothetical protein
MKWGEETKRAQGPFVILLPGFETKQQPIEKKNIQNRSNPIEIISIVESKVRLGV